MNKIIIHNHTNIEDVEILEYIATCLINQKKIPLELGCVKFEDGVRVSFFRNKKSIAFRVEN